MASLIKPILHLGLYNEFIVRVDNKAKKINLSKSFAKYEDALIDFDNKLKKFKGSKITLDGFGDYCSTIHYSFRGKRKDYSYYE